ncbi:MAG: glycosyltransferase, partial [Lachnospiraceae bacterium]|nr:glycosyltransferase [Lachnospiraceae bacterium]
NERCIAELKKRLPEYFAFDNAVSDTDSYIATHSVLGMELAERERVKTLNTLASRFNTVLYTRSDTGALEGVLTRGGVLTHTEMPKIFNLSRINLNITIRPIETGLPLRIFDIMGCKGFVLSNYQDEIGSLFNIGEDIEVYSDYEELVSKCAYYLEHEDERKRIAENGYKKVSENYTYENRIMTMFNVILGDGE